MNSPTQVDEKASERITSPEKMLADEQEKVLGLEAIIRSITAEKEEAYEEIDSLRLYEFEDREKLQEQIDKLTALLDTFAEEKKVLRAENEQLKAQLAASEERNIKRERHMSSWSQISAHPYTEDADTDTEMDKQRMEAGQRLRGIMQREESDSSLSRQFRSRIVSQEEDQKLEETEVARENEEGFSLTTIAEEDEEEFEAQGSTGTDVKGKGKAVETVRMVEEYNFSTPPQGLPRPLIWDSTLNMTEKEEGERRDAPNVNATVYSNGRLEGNVGEHEVEGLSGDKKLEKGNGIGWKGRGLGAVIRKVTSRVFVNNNGGIS